MASQTKGEDAQPAPDSQQMASSSTTDWRSKVVGFYSNTKKDAETYPFVWASYIFVYGTLGGWLAYRFYRLRRAEDRVLALQAKVQKQIEDRIKAERAAATSKAVSSAATPKAVSSAATPKAVSSAATLKADKAPQVATPKPME